MAKTYELFIKTGCPYCVKVENFMQAAGIELPLRNISTEAGAREELIRRGGKAQVPCLFIDGQPLYESSDIVSYLRANVA